MLLTLVLLFGASGSVPARDTKHMLPINAGTNTPAAKDKLGTRACYALCTIKVTKRVSIRMANTRK
jgi:hypothetical protein